MSKTSYGFDPERLFQTGRTEPVVERCESIVAVRGHVDSAQEIRDTGFQKRAVFEMR